MTITDPFASAPAGEEAQATPEPAEPTFEAPPAEAPKKAAPKKAIATATVDVKPNLLPVDEGKVVLTFKGGTGFDAPWIVIHAKDLNDAEEQISGDNAARLARIMERAQVAGQHFAKLGGGRETQAAPQRQAAPAAAQQPPAGSPPSPGEGWVYKSGNKNGRSWQGWMPPRGSDAKPVFF